MARLIGRDDLKDMKGRISADFRAANLTTLHAEFLVNAADTNKKAAAEVLTEFYRVADQLYSRETEFNQRARPDSATLMNHLRGPAHLSAMRAFSAAKEKLLTVNEKVGQHIIRLVQRDIDASARTSARANVQMIVQ